MTHRVLILGALALLASPSLSSAQSWIQAASLPGVGRHHPVNFTLNGYGYAVTGSTTQAGNTDDFFRYDPAQNSWEILPDFPGTDRSYAYGGAFNGKGYLGFGSAGGYLADLWEYDPVSEQWTQLPSLPATGRQHPAFIITDDGKIFVGLGNANVNFRDWWEYDIASQIWTRKADLPAAARHHPFYFNIGRIPYVGFGHGTGIYKDFYRFDPDDGTWTRMADFPGEGRVAGTQLSYGGKGYILSGDGEDHQRLETGEFWEYEPAQDEWSPLPPHPGSGRWAPGNFVIGNSVYFMAGQSTVRWENDMWRFDLTDPASTEPPALAEATRFSVFPNPVMSRVLHLSDLSGTREPATIRLVGVDGRRICELESASGAIRIPAGVAPGNYFLSIRASDGEWHARRITIL